MPELKRHLVTLTWTVSGSVMAVNKAQAEELFSEAVSYYIRNDALGLPGDIREDTEIDTETFVNEEFLPGTDYAETIRLEGSKILAHHERHDYDYSDEEESEAQ